MDQDLPLGAHLVTPRLGYEHHGIHVGGGQVEHYSGFCRGARRGPVEEVTLAEFRRGRGFRIQVHRGGFFAPREIVERARARVGESRYSLVANNCEHFCEWCVNDRRRSRQVDRVLRALGIPLLDRLVSGAIETAARFLDDLAKV